jgi:pyruvate dehydrogenase E2 component (dihydrolipoamide acetyltransferase)
MRKAIAAAMSRSKREIPHYYLSQTVPMQHAAEWLAAENAKRPITGRLLMAVIQLKAVALALADFPDLNGFYRDGAHQPSTQVHTGVAISLRQGGLVAPAIHDVAELTLDELMKALADLVRRARAGSLRSSEMSDPTITVSNLGEGGVESVFPIIYPPQVAIVGFGTLAPRPWVAPDGGVHVAPTVVASLGADHRVSDGHRGALFLAQLARKLQEPENL